MRSFQEPTQKNLLRPALIFGVPFSALLALVMLVVAIQTIGQGTTIGNLLSCASGAIGFVVLRLLTRWARTGWDEMIFFWIEKLFQRIRDWRK